jgi:hypothetical protein
LILFKAGSFGEFFKAARVLNNHWGNRWQHSEEMLDILKAFINFYVQDDNNNGWYSGFAPECPTTNPLEGHNRQFKDRATFRNRTSAREFLEIAAKHIGICSESPEHQVSHIYFLYLNMKIQ